MIYNILCSVIVSVTPLYSNTLFLSYFFNTGITTLSVHSLIHPFSIPIIPISKVSLLHTFHTHSHIPSPPYFHISAEISSTPTAFLSFNLLTTNHTFFLLNSSSFPIFPNFLTSPLIYTLINLLKYLFHSFLLIPSSTLIFSFSLY